MGSVVKNIYSALKEEIKLEVEALSSRGVRAALHRDASAAQYAGAIFQMATEVDKVGDIRDDFNVLSDTILVDNEILSFFISPFVDGKIKISVFERVYKNPMQIETFNMVCLLLERNLINHLPAIVAFYEELCNKKDNLVEVRLISATNIESDYIESFKKAVEKLVNSKVELRIDIDTNLIGGVIIEVAGVVYDYSIRTSLNHLKGIMLACDIPS